MNAYNRPAWRSAVAIHELLQQQQLEDVTLPAQLWQEAEQLTAKINQADQCGWQVAGKQLRERYLQLSERLRYRISEMERELQGLLQQPYRSPLRTIYNDICSLEEEFDDVDISLSYKQIRCTTDEITLEGIELGRFSIALNWAQINEPQPYQVEALDPNPAASSDSTTHPHVQNYRLCEGEGEDCYSGSFATGQAQRLFHSCPSATSDLQPRFTLHQFE